MSPNRSSPKRLASIYVDIPALRPGTVGAYVLALLCAALAMALRLAIDPYVVGAQYITFFPAVIITTLISGFRAGLLCIILSAAATNFFVLPPHWSFYIEHPGELLALLLFILAALSTAILIAGLRFAIEAYRELSRKLEGRVEESGAELAKVQQRLEHEATFRAMFNISSVGKFEVEPASTRFLRVNAAMCKLVGYSEAELLARTVPDITHPDDRDDSRELARRLDAGESDVFDVEKRYIRKDGTVVWVRTTVNAIRDEFGRPLRHTVVAQDLSARKQAEQALEASNARLQLALNATRLGWWQYDRRSRVILVDARLKEIFDFTDHETPIDEFIKRVHPDDLERVWADREAALNPADPKPYAHEYRIRRRDGEVRWVEAHGLAEFDGAGDERRMVNFVGTVQDITERKHSEELVRRQADLLNQSHDAIFALQTGGRGIVYWSRGAERLYGFTAAEAEGRRTHELLQTRAPIPIEDIDAQIVRGGSWYGELTHTTRDGRDIVVESRLIRVSYDGETFALETNRDITERKEREEREHLLMREVNHRAKNILSVVDAIARQTTTKNPEDFAERFSERIQALSANQELLVRNEWRGVEIEDLVRAQLSHFVDLIGSRIDLDGPKLRLNAASAQAIGLAIHELSTNAGKYGALSTDKGRVDIFWATDGDTLTMGWTERDGPPVFAPKRRGFGTTVMETMAARSVNGNVQLDHAPSGLSWRLTCPAAGALELGWDHKQILGLSRN